MPSLKKPPDVGALTWGGWRDSTTNADWHSTTIFDFSTMTAAAAVQIVDLANPKSLNDTETPARTDGKFDRETLQHERHKK